MPITPEEYRTKHEITKDITLESGDEFTICKLPIDIYGEFLSLFEIPFSPTMEKENIEVMLREKLNSEEGKVNVFKALKIIIPAGIRAPKIVLEQPGEGELHFDELEMIDKFELFIEIIDFQKLPTDIEKFRERLSRAVGRKFGSTTPPTSV